MPMRYEYFIGRRYLRSKQRQSFIALITFLSIAGVTVGVMALIVVIAVMTGFESDMKSRILGVDAHLILMRHGEAMSGYRQIRERVLTVHGVQAATPFIYSQAMLRTADGVAGIVLRGIDPKTVGGVIHYFHPAELKALAADSGNGSAQVPGIILGVELASKLGVGRGDTVALISPKEVISPMGHLPVMKQFKVVGLFRSGMYEFDETLAFLNLRDAQRLMRMGDAVTGIEIRVKDVYAAPEIGQTITRELGFPYWTRDWIQMNRNLFSALKLEKTVMFIILTLIILVAAFNIASSLIMMVMEKTKDIAILKAMGATRKSIQKIFVIKGMAIGIIGTMIGVGAGVILCALLDRYHFIQLPGDVYYLTTLPVKLQALDVTTIAVSALVICFLATLYPARQAAKLDPVEAIRYGG